jgi:hypothetical protein
VPERTGKNHKNSPAGKLLSVAVKANILLTI